MRDKKGVYYPDFKRYCSKCKEYTFHTEHGFRGNNYRQCCGTCGQENYSEVGL
jgi:ribosomal protein S27AE